MPINASPQYQKAEKEYLLAKSKEDRIEKLKIMIQLSPKHKGAESLLAELRHRLSKLKEEIKKEKEIKKRTGNRGIAVKKECDSQIVLLGMANSGKSLILNKLTNANSLVSDIPFTTKKPVIGTLDMGMKIQVVEIPSLKLNEEDKELLSIANTSELICLVVSNSIELKKILNELKDYHINNKKIVILNKIDKLNPEEEEKIRKISFFVKISALNNYGINELKKKIFEHLGVIRVYTQENNKISKEKPLILKENSKIKDACQKIHKDFLKNFDFARIWGPSAKFSGQRVGGEHILKDQDILEIHTK
jgi:hypothetical protein